jgi:N4-gp56 family major capsid protein
MGIYMDDQILARLREASTSSPDHAIGLDGRANQSEAGDNAVTLAGITEARKLLKKQNLETNGAFLVVSTEQEKELLDLDNFRNADKYGSREALLNGEIGRIYGFRVMVHNRVAQYEAFAYTQDAVGIAVQQEIEFETDRPDPRLAATDYAFRMLMGSTVLDSGKKVVWMLGDA